MKLIIAGHGRHGKDTVCEILRDDYGMTFQSSSAAALEYFIYPILKKLLGYDGYEEAYADRRNHRALWYELIKAVNFNEPTTLAKVIFSNKDVYCGIRNITELKGLLEASPEIVTIWVDGSGRHPPEDDKSCTVTPFDMEYILDNNGTIEELKTHIDTLMKSIKGK